MFLGPTGHMMHFWQVKNMLSIGYTFKMFAVKKIEDLIAHASKKRDSNSTLSKIWALQDVLFTFNENFKIN